jgi:zinc transport system substrate-binding protein
MPAHRRKVLSIPAAAAFLCTLSLAPVQAGSTDKVEVYVVNYPLKYFADRIAGDSATIVFPAPSGEDPAFWTPGVDTVKAFQEADLILLNGAGYARWVKKVSLPRAKMVDTSKGFEDRFISSEEITTHSHGPEGKHAHESLAFTTWLDFELAARQARAVADALGRTVPGKKEDFDRNYAALKEDLQALDRQIGEFVVGKESRPLIASHPVYQYLTRRYGLNVRSVHWEPDEAPDLDQWSELKAILRENPAQWMIWEGEPRPEVVEELEKRGVQSLVFNPAGSVPDSGGFLSVMKENVANLKAAFQ